MQLRKNKVAEAPETDNLRKVRVVEDESGMLDIPFLILTLLLVAIGLIMLFSASYARAYNEDGSNPAKYFIRQGSLAAVGIVIMLVISRLNYQYFSKFSKPLLVVAIILLIGVLAVGRESNGAKRWIQLPFVGRFQPSEIVKLAVVMSFATLMTQYRDRMSDWRYGLLPYVVILGIIAVLLYMEPHMSATLIILAVGFVMMIIGGTKFKHLTLLGLAAVLLVGIYLMTKGYTGDRLAAWMDPESDPSDKGYQTLQSQYAIGSGGLLGLGFGKSRQKYLYLPEEHNDYIFAIVCEELGFVGAVCIIVLFALLIIRGYWIAMHARDRFGLLLASGLTTLLALQVALNVAVVSNLLPSTGISLPFFSYGGTALMIQLAEMGLILSVSRWNKNKLT